MKLSGLFEALMTVAKLVTSMLLFFHAIYSYSLQSLN